MDLTARRCRTTRLPRRPRTRRTGGATARIEPVAAQKFGMCAFLDDAALIEHDQPVHRGDGREPVRDGDDGLPLHQSRALLDRRLDFGIERRRCLVEHQDRRVLQNHAGDGDALALAAGEFYAALADMRVDSRAAPYDPLAPA